MESDPSAAENSEQSPTSQAAGRSYECNFCKRGFTNAQALGGHMNIHRKDKANLKLINQSSSNSNQTNLLLNTHPKSNPAPLYSPNQPPQSKSSTDLEKNQNKRPWIFPPEVDDAITSRDQTHLGKLSQQLPLFSAKSSINSKNNQEPGKGWSSTSSHEQLGPELDLELRLGHEMPRDNSSAGTGMNKFL